MAEPVTIFAFLNSAIKFSEYAVKLCAVGSENGVFVRLILRVRNDVEEVERLISTPSVKKTLISTPGKLLYIKNVILSTKTSLNDIGRWVDRVRTDKEAYGSISMENRLRWVFNDKDKLAVRTLELSTNHQSLSNVLSYLMPLEKDDAIDLPKDAPPPNYHDATFMDEIFPMSSRQRRQALYRDSEAAIEIPKEGRPQVLFDDEICTDSRGHVAVLQLESGQRAQQQFNISPSSQKSFQQEIKPTYNAWEPSQPKLRETKSLIALSHSNENTSIQHQPPTPHSLISAPSNQNWSTLHIKNAQTPPNPPESSLSIPRRALPNQPAMFALSQSTTTSPSMTSISGTEISCNLSPLAKQQTSPGMSSLTFDQTRVNSSQPALIVDAPEVSPPAFDQTTANPSQPTQSGGSLGMSDRQWLISQVPRQDQTLWTKGTQAPQVSIGNVNIPPNTVQASVVQQEFTAPRYTSEHASPILQQFSGTNYVGPINAYDMFTEMETSSVPTPTPKVDLRSAPQITVPANIPHDIHSFSLPQDFLPVQRRPQHEQDVGVATLSDNLSLCLPEEPKSFTELPVEVKSLHTMSVDELPVDYSTLHSPCQQKSPSNCAETPAGEANRTMKGPFSSASVSAVSYAMEAPIQEPSKMIFSTHYKLETHSQNSFQYPKHATQSQTYTQAQVQTLPQPIYPTQYQSNFQSQTQPQLQPPYPGQPLYHSQSQETPHPYEAQHQTPHSQPTQQNPYMPPRSPVSTYAPTPVPWTRHHQPYRDMEPVSPPTQSATPVQNFGSIDGHQEPISRVTTLGEVRRRNQRALLDAL